MNNRLTTGVAVWVAVLISASVQPAWAQQDAPQSDAPAAEGVDAMSMDNMDHSSMPGMDHGTDQGTSKAQKMDHGKMKGMDHSTPQKMDHSKMQGMDHGAGAAKSESGMTGMRHGSMQGGSAPANARDPHAYSGGYDFGRIPRLHLADELNFGSLLVDRFEAVRSAGNTAVTFDLQAWYGRDYDRAVLKAEGGYDNSKLEEASTELLWSHAVAAYWNSQLGVRYDSGEDPDRTWLAFGIQGLAPYWFEVDVTGYIGEAGRTALNLEAEYELLFTQRLILQPRIEADLVGKDDNQAGIGSGLSELAVGIRLRYEIRREFAPYIGVEWLSKFGGTADYARAAGLDTNETQAVAGLRFWF